MSLQYDDSFRRQYTARISVGEELRRRTLSGPIREFYDLHRAFEIVSTSVKVRMNTVPLHVLVRRRSIRMEHPSERGDEAMR